MTDETWRPVSGLEARYEVSSIGRVRNADGQFLVPQLSGRGYPRVRLFGLDGQRHHYMLHRLMCEAFNGPAPSPTAICRHLNDDRADLRPKNLAWGEHRDNVADGSRNGVRHLGRLTPDQAPVIRRRFAEGQTRKNIAAEFGVNYSTVHRIVAGTMWP